MTTTGHIKYNGGFKYQLTEDYAMSTSIKPTSDIEEPPSERPFIVLDTAGNLTVKQGYAWDGPSGPVKDNEENLRASLIHDALYQLMRTKNLDHETHRKAADQIFRDVCKADGVSRWRAWAYYRALRKFGKKATDPRNIREVLLAPSE